VHQVVQKLAPSCVPLCLEVFLTEDGRVSYGTLAAREDLRVMHAFVLPLSAIGLSATEAAGADHTERSDVWNQLLAGRHH
jgi:hypothetical protein